MLFYKQLHFTLGLLSKFMFSSLKLLSSWLAIFKGIEATICKTVYGLSSRVSPLNP